MHLFFYYIICTIYKLSRSILDPPTDLGIDQTILDFGLDWAKPKTSCIEGFFFFYYSYSFSGISIFFFFFNLGIGLRDSKFPTWVLLEWIFKQFEV